MEAAMQAVMEALTEVKEARKQAQSSPAAEEDSRVVEAEQTEIAVWESLLEIRYA